MADLMTHGLESVSNAFQTISEKVFAKLPKNDSGASEAISDEVFEEVLNREQGTLSGYDCKDCLNRGYFYRVRGIRQWVEPCKCVEIRRNLKRLQESGLGRLADACSFENFSAREEWQQKAKNAVERFYGAGNWLYIAGQPGCGKTHLCTALVKKFIMDGHEVRYFRWIEDGEPIRFAAFGELEEKIRPLQECEILYIDDFLKIKYGEKVGARDISFAFNLLDARYISGKKTIISTEHYISEVTDMDEALGSRIAQMSKGFNIAIKREKGRNYRLK